MPHILASDISLPPMPSSIGEYRFHLLASDGYTTLIPTSYKNRDFILKIKKRDKNLYIGYDKGSRISPVGIIKDALLILKEYAKGIESHNLNKSSLKEDTNSNYLKSPKEFLDENLHKKSSIYIEIGFGSGRHLLHLAREHKDSLVVGIEIHKPSIDQVLRRLEVEGIENVVIVSYDARLFLELLLFMSVDMVFLHFPVPWDKKPHRRVVSSSFVEQLKRVLKQDGKFELRSDSEGYFEYTLKSFLESPSAKIDINKNKNLEISSKYEDRWKRQNRDIFDLIFYNTSPKDSQKEECDFIFYGKKSLKNLQNRVTIKKMEHFVHIEKIYKIDGGGELIALSFGAFNAPERRYLIFKDGSCRYFGSTPIETRANILAHCELEKLLE